MGEEAEKSESDCRLKGSFFTQCGSHTTEQQFARVSQSSGTNDRPSCNNPHYNPNPSFDLTALACGILYGRHQRQVQPSNTAKSIKCFHEASSLVDWLALIKLPAVNSFTTFAVSNRRVNR